MTNDAIMTPDQVMAELSKLDTANLVVELYQSLEITVQQIVRMAAIIRILEERGERLDEIKIGMMAHLRLVAYGQLLPEALAKLQGSPMLLKRVASLPIPDQREIIKSGSVEVASPDSPVDARNVPLLALGREEIFQVFGDGVVRNLGSQRSYLRDHAKATRKKSEDPSGVILDAKRGGIMVNGYFLARKDLLDYLGRLEK